MNQFVKGGKPSPPLPSTAARYLIQRRASPSITCNCSTTLKPVDINCPKCILSPVVEYRRFQTGDQLRERANSMFTVSFDNS